MMDKPFDFKNSCLWYEKRARLHILANKSPQTQVQFVWRLRPYLEKVKFSDREGRIPQM